MKPVRGKEEGGSGLSPLIKIDQSPSHGLLGLAFLRPEAAFHNNADMTDISVRKKSAAWGKILDKKTKFCQISLKLDLPQNILSCVQLIKEHHNHKFSRGILNIRLICINFAPQIK